MDYVISLLGAQLARGAGHAQAVCDHHGAVHPAGPGAGAGAHLALCAVSSAAVGGYIWLMRGTPLMLQMLFIYFALPFVPVIGVRLPTFRRPWWRSR